MDLSLIRKYSEIKRIPITVIAERIGMSVQNIHRCIRENRIEAGVLEKIA